MFLSDKFNWTYIESVQTDVVELPYVNNDLSMFILLPRDIAGLQKVRGNRELKSCEKQECHYLLILCTSKVKDWAAILFLRRRALIRLKEKQTPNLAQHCETEPLGDLFSSWQWAFL